MRKILLIILLCATTAVLLRCVSKSVTDARFAESNALVPVTPSVTPADPENFTFAIVGDLHIGGQHTERFQEILTAAAAESDAFIILLGDIVDTGKREDIVAFHSALSSLGWASKAFPVIGNHDIFNEGWEAYKELNGPSHYTFTVGNSKFIALDSADGSVGNPQVQWFESELTKTRPKHLFVLSHYMPVVPGVRTYLKFANAREAAHLMKLSVTNQVTAWLGGHYHSYIVDKVDGISYVVAGGGGGMRMPPVTSYFFVQVAVHGDDVSYQLRVVQ